jgi:hypothetical protein
MWRFVLIAFLAACAAHVPPPAEATALVTELYQRHDAHDSPFFQTTSREKVDAYFEPSIAELIWKDSAGDDASYDFDPLYDAQDFEITKFTVHPAVVKDDAARVLVTFENFRKPERITYSLVPVAGKWRIADVEYDHGTLRHSLVLNAR